jgi:hypothetical protein
VRPAAVRNYYCSVFTYDLTAIVAYRPISIRAELMRSEYADGHSRPHGVLPK